MAEKTLKEIALEILEKYKESERTVIYEYSGDIEGDMSDLKAAYQKYKKAIETAAGKTVPSWEYKSMERTVYKLVGALLRPRHINCPECGKGYYILDNRIIGELPQKTGNISRAILLDLICSQFPADNKTATQIIGIIESMPAENVRHDM